MLYIRAIKKKKNTPANLPTEDENTGKEKELEVKKEIVCVGIFIYN